MDITIRPPRPEDAAGIFDFDQLVKQEALLHGLDPDESVIPRAERRDWLEAAAVDGNSLVLLVEHKRSVIGFLEARIAEKPRANDHVLRFYLSVAKTFWRQGVGSALIGAMIQWARERPQVEKISLSVLSTNKRAIALYEKLGFKEEGRKIREYRLPDGAYADDVLMAFFLRRPHA